MMTLKKFFELAKKNELDVKSDYLTHEYCEVDGCDGYNATQQLAGVTYNGYIAEEITKLLVCDECLAAYENGENEEE